MKNILKRGLSIFLAIAIFFSSAYVGLNEIDFSGLFAVKAKAASSGTCGDNLTWTLDDGVLTISGKGEMEDFGPFNAPWYSVFYDTKSIVIENGVTSIGSWAFYSFTSLVSVTIGDSVTSIGRDAFCDCDILTSVKIGEGVTSIGDKAFWGCMNLPSIIIPDNVTSIGGYAFEDCYSLNLVAIPNSVRIVGDYAFYNCENLVTVTIGSGLSSITEKAFDGCTSLISISVDGNNPNYSSDEGVLYTEKKTELLCYPVGKTNVSYIIPDSVECIGAFAFEDCDMLSSVIIPDSVTDIGKSAFYGCDILSSVIIPDSVTDIGKSAFYGCDILRLVTIGENVTNIGSSVFSYCENLEEIYWNAKNVEDFTDSTTIFHNAGTSGAGINLVFGETVETVPAYLCYESSSSYKPNITSVIIGDSVTSIGDYAFHDCDNLSSIIIPNSVIKIGDSAFRDCDDISSIIIPDSVVNIGDSAFTHCDNLSSITISKNVTNINEYTFNYCEKLTSVSIPNSVKSVGEGAFAYCSNLSSLAIGENVTSIGEGAFYKCTSLTSVLIPDSVLSIGKDAFDDCTMLKTFSFGTGLSSVNEDAFDDCTNLISINVDENNLNYSSDKGVLFNKDKTTLIMCPQGKDEYVIPVSVISIEDYAFASCTNLILITIPDSVTSIGNSVFYNCTNIASITIPDSVTSIGNSVFYRCTNLTSITIPDGVTNIGNDVFYNCKSLVSITIPNSVTSVGAWAFDNCDSLTTVYYSGTEEQWNAIDIGNFNDELLSASIIFNSSGGSDVGESVITESNGTLTVAHKDEKQVYSYNYKDSYFDNKATEYNHKLATMSLCLALSTFQSEEQYITSGNAGELLNKCGFGKFESFGSYKIDIDDADNVGCLISQKKIGDTTLVAVAVRSGGYGMEWASNFTLGDDDDHQGFNTAANLVKERIVNYIEQYNISGDIKLWITGYSRGAATATQTAAKITNEGIISKENVYAYGFATPAGAIEDSDPTNLDRYGNIFNILNFNDIVPRVAPEQWNFGRYGKTYYLPFYENSYVSSKTMEVAVKAWFLKYGFDYNVDWFIPLYSELPYYKGQLSNDSVGVFQNKLVEELSMYMVSREHYFKNYQVDIRNIIIEGGFSNITEVIPEILGFLALEAVVNSKYISTALLNVPLLAKAHSAFGAYYLGWMETIPADKALEYLNDGSTRHWLFNCPVDVYAYDTNGNLVAAIENDMPVEIEGSTFSYGVDENGQKYFYLPVDAEYNITVKAREKCETTCTVNEFTGGSLTESRVVTFEEIPMEKGEELSVSTGTYSEKDIIEGTKNGSSAEYVVQDENEQVIEPDVDVSGEEIEDYTFNVSVEYDENKGIVYGGGTFTIGQFCQVTAENKPGYRFSKWTVNGETVSTDSTYRFAVKEDVTIVAEYVPCEHPEFVDEVVAPTCTEEGYTKHTCEVCTYSYNDTKVKAKGHKLSDWITDKKATANAAGSKHKECTICEEIIETATIKQLKCSKPSIKSASNNGKNIKVTWKKVSGADYYYVYRKAKGGSYSYIGKTKKTSYTDKTAKAGKTYTYKLRAKNEVGYSSYSSTKTVKHLDQPALKTATNTTSGVKITWGRVSKASGYKIYRKTSDGWKYLGKTTKAYFTDKTAKSGKKYTYTVKAYNGDYSSSYSSTGVSRYYLADPTLKTPSSTKSGVSLKWSKVTGAEGYMVYRKTGSGSYSRIATVKGSSKVTYTDKSAKKGKTYTYKIKAYKSKTYSAYSNTKKLKTNIN